LTPSQHNLTITREITDPMLAGNALRKADLAWAGNGDLDRIYSYQAQYALIQGWPLTTTATLDRIKAEVEEWGHSLEDIASRYQKSTAEKKSITPLDFYFTHTEHMGADNIFLTIYPPLSTPSDLDGCLAHMDNHRAKASLCHYHIALGGEGKGAALQGPGRKMNSLPFRHSTQP
jgi:hypothetical protein